MSDRKFNFVKVADLKDVSEGKPKAVKVEGRSIAIFLHKGNVYATDNQCPHMGYPLTRGRLRNGVLTCDWHGYSYDVEGGGCFTGGCDDLDTFPVEVRSGEIYIDVKSGGSKGKDAHFLLLKEGLFSQDSWTISKAIAIMLAKGVSEKDALNLLLRYMGKHIATGEDAFGGGDRLSLMVNGTKVARQYDPEDRLIPLMMAAWGASGRSGDRPQVQPLPPPVSWEKLESWIRAFSADKRWEGIEKALITARRIGGHDHKLLPLIYDCALEPFFLGFADQLVHTGYLAELLEEFGWDQVEEIACNLAAKMLGRGRNVPDETRRAAIELFKGAISLIDDLAQGPASDPNPAFDEDAFVESLVSGDLNQSFEAVTKALQARVDIQQLATAMVLTAADRMARTPVNMSPGWGSLSWELRLSAAVRTALRHGGFRMGAKALYHAAWQFYSDRWVNVKSRPLSELRSAGKLEASDQDAALKIVLEAIEQIQVHEVGRLAQQYLKSGFSGDRLLREVGQLALKDDAGWGLLRPLRTVFDEWQLCQGHPARDGLLIGMARWATDVRRRTDSQSAALTAQRFARGQTAVELYE